MRRREHLGLGAGGNLELAVVLVRHGTNRLQQRHDLAPLDVPVRRLAEDLLDCVTVTAAEMRFHRDPFVGVLCPRFLADMLSRASTSAQTSLRPAPRRPQVSTTPAGARESRA